VPLKVVRISGPLATLPAVGALLADASGLPVEEVVDEEGGLRGAARLAARALAGSPDLAPGALAAVPAVRRRHVPQWSPERRAAVRARWRAGVAAALASAPLASVE
jgi:sugar (pentulose or hexulose) kinase